MKFLSYSFGNPWGKRKIIPSHPVSLLWFPFFSFPTLALCSKFSCHGQHQRWQLPTLVKELPPLSTFLLLTPLLLTACTFKVPRKLLRNGPFSFTCFCNSLLTLGAGMTWWGWGQRTTTVIHAGLCSDSPHLLITDPLSSVGFLGLHSHFSLLFLVILSLEGPQNFK